MAGKSSSKGIWVVVVAVIGLVSLVALDQLGNGAKDSPVATEVATPSPGTGEHSGNDGTVVTPPAARTPEAAPAEPAGPVGNM